MLQPDRRIIRGDVSRATGAEETCTAASLSPAQLAQYRSQGYLAPLRVMEEAEAAELLSRLEAVEREEGGRLSNESNQKPYLLFPFLAEVIRDARILDAVECQSASKRGSDSMLVQAGPAARR